MPRGGSSVQEEEIHPSVVVVVQGRDSATECLEGILVVGREIDLAKLDAGTLRHVIEKKRFRALASLGRDGSKKSIEAQGRRCAQ